MTPWWRRWLDAQGTIRRLRRELREAQRDADAACAREAQWRRAAERELGRLRDCRHELADAAEVMRLWEETAGQRQDRATP